MGHPLLFLLLFPLRGAENALREHAVTLPRWRQNFTGVLLNVGFEGACCGMYLFIVTVSYIKEEK